jgi:16S rRNA (guanine527-N7)-methyltransferase
MTQTYDIPGTNEGTLPSIVTAIDCWTAATSNDIILDKTQMEQLSRFHDELLYWNERVNLISRKDIANVWERHILHSLTILKYASIPTKARLLDVGTGGGLPGLPLKIARPDLKVVLVDSIRKKINCAQMFAQHTGLRDIDAVCMRAEEILHSTHYQKGFDVIVSRAVAPTTALLSWVRPLMRQQATCWFLKGGDLSDEVAQARADHPGIDIKVINIDLFGAPWFANEHKRIVTCRFA